MEWELICEYDDGDSLVEVYQSLGQCFAVKGLEIWPISAVAARCLVLRLLYGSKWTESEAYGAVHPAGYALTK